MKTIDNEIEKALQKTFLESQKHNDTFFVYNIYKNNNFDMVHPVYKVKNIYLY